MSESGDDEMQQREKRFYFWASCSKLLVLIACHVPNLQQSKQIVFEFCAGNVEYISFLRMIIIIAILNAEW